MQFGFGSGVLIATNTVANSTPRNFGILQDVTVDFDAPVKELMGAYQFPVAVARGKGKITGKAKFANIDILAYNDLFFGATAATGQSPALIANEAGSIPGVSTYTITVANSATWTKDEGVYNRTTGKYMQQVASGPTAGQYSVAAGVYTFAAADASTPVYISYDYTVAATGHTVTLTNQFLGTQPVFSMVLSQSYNGQQFNLRLNQCIANKLGFATKLEDFQIPSFDFAAFADASNNIGSLTTVL